MISSLYSSVDLLGVESMHATFGKHVHRVCREGIVPFFVSTLIEFYKKKFTHLIWRDI